MGTNATRCAVCGGEFSATRSIVDGVAMHPRCSIMSHGSHTHEEMANAVNLIWKLRTALQKIAACEKRADGDVVDIAQRALHDLFPTDRERDQHFIAQYASGQ